MFPEVSSQHQLQAQVQRFSLVLALDCVAPEWLDQQRLCRWRDIAVLSNLDQDNLEALLSGDYPHRRDRVRVRLPQVLADSGVVDWYPGQSSLLADSCGHIADYVYNCFEQSDVDALLQTKMSRGDVVAVLIGTTSPNQAELILLGLNADTMQASLQLQHIFPAWLDVPVTVLDALNIEHEEFAAQLVGQSLLAPPEAHLRSVLQYRMGRTASVFSLTWGPWQLRYQAPDRAITLYFLQDDPEARRNIAQRDTETMAHGLRRLLAIGDPMVWHQDYVASFQRTDENRPIMH